MRSWWRTHRRRLSEENGYDEAVIAVVIAASDLLGDSYRLRYAAREIVRAYVALQRIFSPAVPPWDTSPLADY